jgi:hypothetical protein
MNYVFCWTTFILASSTSDSTKSKRVINNEEIAVDDWKISKKVQKKQIYQTSSFNLFKTDFTIKTKERNI